jgi:hypothetical protein
VKPQSGDVVPEKAAGTAESGWFHTSLPFSLLLRYRQFAETKASASSPLDCGPDCTHYGLFFVYRQIAESLLHSVGLLQMNSKPIGRRPKLVLYPTRAKAPQAGVEKDDFAIYASYRGSTAARFFGTLKVVRKTDSRLLYPFDGAEDLGPFATKADAIKAAQQKGEEVVSADLAFPEL